MEAHYKQLTYNTSTVQALYKVMFKVHWNGPCYKRILLLDIFQLPRTLGFVRCSTP